MSVVEWQGLHLGPVCLRCGEEMQKLGSCILEGGTDRLYWNFSVNYEAKETWE